MPSKVHTDAKVQDLLDLFTAAKSGWTFDPSHDSELVELMQHSHIEPREQDDLGTLEDDGFTFVITYVRVESTDRVTYQNLVLFHNDTDGLESHVQVIDRKGRRVCAFTARDGS